jgi:cytochrome c553
MVRPALHAAVAACVALGAPACSPGPAADEASGSPDEAAGNDVLPWAFVINDSIDAAAAPPDPDELVTVPGSALSLRRGDIRLAAGPPDWHPDGHPPMPEVVSRGRGEQVMPCGYCHLPNGQGKPENAGLAGQPQVYLEQQMADFRAGLRRTGEPRMLPPSLMMTIGAAATEEEARKAAAYFASMSFRPWIRVVETDSVPATRFAGWIHEVMDDDGLEPIGTRVVETPEDLERTKLRDDASGFIAWVPRGAVERGRSLTRRGGADGVPCTTCHGEDLRGLGPIPALAGRSPSYLARQLWDFQQGHRKGAWSALMAGAVAELTPAQIVDLVAFAASLEP